MSNLSKLEEDINKCLNDFSKEIEFSYQTFEQNGHGPYATKDDMRELAKQTFYMVHNVKDCIIKYLKQNS